MGEKETRFKLRLGKDTRGLVEILWSARREKTAETNKKPKTPPAVD